MPGSEKRVHDYVAVCLAVWFHDAIYDTRRKDNEEQSAAYARAVLTPQGVSEADFYARCSHSSSRPKRIKPRLMTPTANCLLDADLAILGSPSRL